MTYLHLLHHLHSAINSAMPLLSTRYKSISFPGSNTPVENDPGLMALVSQVRQLNQTVDEVQRKLREGEILENDEADPALLPPDHLI